MTTPIRPRVPVPFVADLTGVAFIDYACLSALAIPAGPRTCLVSRSPTGRFGAPPSLVARSSLLSPGGAAPLRLAHCGVPLVHTARSRVISEVSMSYRSIVRAGGGPRHADGAVLAPRWLS
jgi:hypothetical protein